MQAALQESDRDARELFERYRLHQNRLFKECVDDARLMAKRTHVATSPDESADLVLRLAVALFEKRCSPWAEFRESPDA